MRHYLFLLFLLVSLQLSAQSIQRIGFGSCAHQNKDQPVLTQAASSNLDVFIFLGDNIYGDTENMEILREKYDKLGQKPEFQQLRSSCEILATWDDHDYGANDSGKDYQKKAESKEIFLDFWQVDEESERRQHEGIYDAKIYGEEGKRVQIILLDTRTFRDGLLEATRKKGMRDYRPHEKAGNAFLGEAQWKWLEDELQKEAELRIIATSTQFGIEYNGYEAWANFPFEQKRMLDLIEKTKAEGVIFLSGDVHYAEISRRRPEGLYPIYDVTSSGITQTWRFATDNQYRLGDAFMGNNFGMIQIDWSKKEPEISMGIYDVDGEIQLEEVIGLDELSWD